jgi:hypothetical protein
MYRTRRFALALFIIFNLIACRKFISIEPSPGLIETKMLFSDAKTAMAAVSGIYAQMNTNSFSFSCGGLSIFSSLSADDIFNTSSTSLYDVFLKNSLLANDGVLYPNFWSVAYKNIYRANAILEGLENTKSINDTIKSRLKGEMLFVRAFNYFYLINLFGDVPLILETDYKKNANIARTPVSIIYKQMVDDLLLSKVFLMPHYSTSGKVVPNKWTAAALLARVFLYQKKWNEAENEANEVLTSSMYSLAPINAVFLKNSPETIWEMYPVNEVQLSGPGPQFIPSSTTVRPSFSLTTELYNSFETGDKRKIHWTGTNIVGGVNYNYPYKQRQRNGTPVNEYNIVFRMAEQYLIRAEARLMQNNLSGAIEDLNVIRERAGLMPIVTGNYDELLNILVQERRSEFFSEWGHRWLDLKRTDKADSVLSKVKGVNWDSSDVLYPIPLRELDYNPNLTQNPGY